ncbi:MAG: HIT family protein [Oscillospiraceae bacterium]|nr:HIT family protein [Oscillospiraceae bacterium]
MEDCIFCKIVNGSVPSKVVFEDEHTMAFMDIAGDVDGHIVVIPKKHCNNILDCDEETLGRLMKTVKKLADHLVDNCGYDGVNLLNASGESAGQSVPHFHIHIIPRKNGDGIDAWPKFNGAKRDVEDVFKEIMIR